MGGGGGGGGGGGEGMEVEVPLSTGALEAMWREDGLRPVLQLADAPQNMAVAGDSAAEAERYRVALSDGGARLQQGVLAASLNHLVASGALRRGTVIRVLEYFPGLIRDQRAIVVIQLEILHTECMLIRSPTIFEANATQHIGVSCSGSLAIHEPCFMPCTQQVISNSSCSPDKRVLDSSVTPRAEPTVINLPYTECFRSMPAQSTVHPKMKQLSSNDHQNQRFKVTATGDAFGPPGNSYASPMLASYLQDSPGLSGAMAAQLTPGAVVAISEHAHGTGMLQPVLQVVEVRMVNNVKNPSAQRFRMVLSDGVYTIQSMLATAENKHVQNGSIQKGSIIHLQEFTCSTIQNHRIIIVIKVYVHRSVCAIMGNPKPYKMRNQRNERGTNFPANAAQANTGKYSSDPGMLGSSAAPRPAQVANNLPYTGPYGGYQGMVGPPIDRAVGSVHNVALEKPPVWKVVGQIKDNNLGYSDKPDLITVKATISCVTELLYHVACPLVVNGKQCNAKATGDVDGMWRCDRCGYTFLVPCKYGCSVRIQIQDHTGTASATAYEEAAEEILGSRAKNLYSMKYKEHDDAQLGDIILGAMGKQYMFQLKIERHLLSGVKCIVLKAEKVNPLAESRRLLERIDTLLQEGSGPGLELHRPTYTGSYRASNYYSPSGPVWFTALGSRLTQASSPGI